MSGGSAQLGRTVRPWAGLVIPPLAWYGMQQGLNAVLHARCGAVPLPVGAGVGVLALAACALAAWTAWPVARWPVSEPHEQARRFVAQVAVGAAAIFALAIAFQTLATLLVPPCAR